MIGKGLKRDKNRLID